MATNLLMNISQDERKRAIFRSRKKFLMDHASDIATAEDRGREEGWREGRQLGAKERNFEIALNALRKKMSIGDIIDITGLIRAEIEGLKIAE